MKNTILVSIVAILIVAGGLYFTLHSSQSDGELRTDVSKWKTYKDSEFGFSIKYPPQYAIETNVVASGTVWGSRSLLTIYDTANTSTYEFHVGPGSLTLQKQPVTANGKIYHTIQEYKESGVADSMIQGIPKPIGELIMVNGVQALKYHFPAGDATDTSSDSYIFIKNDLIYQFGFNSDDPYKEKMLNSITWQ